ncbi:hypothetical protein SUGI_0498180 [Cryptomeria japonica]|nr:hypothetical protein SUGI_0498180 [Cryptomeria japonica]
MSKNRRSSENGQARVVSVDDPREGDDDGDADGVGVGFFSTNGGSFLCESSCMAIGGVTSRTTSLVVVMSPMVGCPCGAWSMLGRGKLGECDGVCKRVGGPSSSPAGDFTVDCLADGWNAFGWVFLSSWRLCAKALFGSLSALVEMLVVEEEGVVKGFVLGYNRDIWDLGGFALDSNVFVSRSWREALELLALAWLGSECGLIIFFTPFLLIEVVMLGDNGFSNPVASSSNLEDLSLEAGDFLVVGSLLSSSFLSSPIEVESTVVLVCLDAILIRPLFQNANGQSVLCVKYEDQISLRSGHVSKGSKNNFMHANSTMKECPEGSVPILEITRKSVETFGSVRKFLNRKSSDPSNGFGSVSNNGTSAFRHNQFAIVRMGVKEVHEIKATFNIWQPFVQSADFFSITQMWVSNPRADGSIMETMQAGWQVCPQCYGSSSPVFFIYYTWDGYASGCLNQMCKAFIQEGQFYPGMPFTKNSIYNGQQMEATISIKRETRGNNIVWALYLQDSLVGHWPTTTFKDLKLHANHVDFGGSVLVANNNNNNGTISKTDMGSGHFAKGGFKKAAYIRNIQLFTTNGTLISERNRTYFATSPNCYSIEGFGSDNKYWGDHIFYGGPGGDVPQCKE